MAIRLASSSPRLSLDAYAVELQALEDYRSFSATTIQRYYRGWLCRARAARQKDAQRQRQQAQAAAAAGAARLNSAARTIQDAWRRFSSRRIFRYYRDLIKFREAGEPRQMLRCINAREAVLVEPAAGLHVRFRLGGSSFPPLVFYKIFTHRPVTDIGAFGPRNYAAESDAMHGAAALHTKPDAAPAAGSAAPRNKQRQRQQYEEFELPAQLREYLRPDGSIGYRSTKGWYRRNDRNGWRPVAERLLLDQEHQAALPAAMHHSGSGSSSSSSSRARRRRRQQRWRGRSSSQQQGDVPGCEAQQTRNQQQQQQQQQGSREGGGSGEEDEGASSSTSSSSRERPVTHYSCTVRREERARRLKQRRRQWLLKMYRTGMQGAAAAAAVAASVCTASGTTGPHALKSAAAAAAAAAAAGLDGVRNVKGKASDGHRLSSGEEEQVLQLLEQRLLGQQAAHSTATAGASSSCTTGIRSGSIDATTAAADDDDADWDVEELVALGLDAGILAWSQRLDFDSYQQHWASSAVTLGSEAVVPESERLQLAQLQQQLLPA
ncbi:hypothetical protein COO60DRAFT_1703123 [Scenedesmus sp. NREL 46B-D3]|nr:hypothetical protein COO60DRAFT_1703123 [Scenedesmus sp. NREL 46B-D3]